MIDNAIGGILLVIVMGVNSAIAAYYYLRIAGAAVLEDPGDVQRSLVRTGSPGRLVATVLSAASVVVLFFASSWLIRASAAAGDYRGRGAEVEAAETERGLVPAPGSPRPERPDR